MDDGKTDRTMMICLCIIACAGLLCVTISSFAPKETKPTIPATQTKE